MRLTHSLYERRKRLVIRLAGDVEAVLVKVSVAAAIDFNQVCDVVYLRICPSRTRSDI